MNSIRLCSGSRSPDKPAFENVIRRVKNLNRRLLEKGFTPMVSLNVKHLYISKYWRNKNFLYEASASQSIEVDYTVETATLAVRNHSNQQTLWRAKLPKGRVNCGPDEWEDSERKGFFYPNSIKVWADKTYKTLALEAQLPGTQMACARTYWQVFSLIK